MSMEPLALKHRPGPWFHAVLEMLRGRQAPYDFASDLIQPQTLDTRGARLHFLEIVTEKRRRRR
jgi:hypothetical protein